MIRARNAGYQVRICLGQVDGAMCDQERAVRTSKLGPPDRRCQNTGTVAPNASSNKLRN
jgi:hypothetical protein